MFWNSLLVTNNWIEWKYTTIKNNNIMQKEYRNRYYCTVRSIGYVLKTNNTRMWKHRSISSKCASVYIKHYFFLQLPFIPFQVFIFFFERNRWSKMNINFHVFFLFVRFFFSFGVRVGDSRIFLIPVQDRKKTVSIHTLSFSIDPFGLYSLSFRFPFSVSFFFQCNFLTLTAHYS